MKSLNRRVWGAIAIGVLLVADCSAEPPSGATGADSVRTETIEPPMMALPVRVVDSEGKPVAGAKVTPWALRWSQGHGLWLQGDKIGLVDPVAVSTDDQGIATVLYPEFRDLRERMRTLAVSLSVDHHDFAFVDNLHIDVPLETSGPHEIRLTLGVPVEIRPVLDDKQVDASNLFAVWSDGRSWQAGTALEKLADGRLRIPAMPPGDNSLLLVRLDGDRATHFSKLTEFKLAPGAPQKLEVSLRPSARVQGMLSDNVPRPVKAGRIKAWTLAPADAARNRVSWFTWAPIQPDGTFTIDGWPAHESIQLIALCDGYVATSGRAPESVKNPRDPAADPFCRPQVFPVVEAERIELAMTPLALCEATVLDEDDKPVAGVSVRSWPNVGWWNGGSQVYCSQLMRGERMLQQRDYIKAIDEAFPQPFEAQTDASGKVTLHLPAGNERLLISSEVYELPVFLGHRDVRIQVVDGQTTEQLLRVQPRGTEQLGEWDKLAGVVFGCSTREGRRICALPDVQKKMEEFAKRFRDAKNQRDPQLLAEAYSTVADAFVGVGDAEEASKWRQKAKEQAAKAEINAVVTPNKEPISN
jgi:hypothetical protein